MSPLRSMSGTPLADNLHRLLAQQGLTIAQAAENTGVNARTIKAILAAEIAKPHARTLNRLAEGLGASVDEFYQSPTLLARRFDRHTNPVVDQVVAEDPSLFSHWSAADFEDLYSRFGAGGALTSDGARAAAAQINRRRAVLDQVALLLETEQGELLERMVQVLFQQVTRAAREPEPAPESCDPGKTAVGRGEKRARIGAERRSSSGR